MKERCSFYGSRARFYFESTLTHVDDIMDTAHKTGTGSIIVFPCPCCGEHICPMRDNLVGWIDAQSDREASERATWSCPACGECFDDARRRKALATSKLIHRGQTVDRSGKIHGNAPSTLTLSVRWTASTNAFSETSIIGKKEWSAKYAQTPEQSEASVRALLQFTYATPVPSSTSVIDSLDVRRLIGRQGESLRGEVPSNCLLLSAGVDLRTTELHWCVVAHCENGVRIVDFGLLDTLHDKMDLDAAIREVVLRAQAELRAKFPAIKIVLCDAGWKPDPVNLACESDPVWFACKGFGSSGLSQDYTKPRSDKSARVIGSSWHAAEVRGKLLIELDSTEAKARLHRGLAVEDISASHAVLMPMCEPDDLREFAYHLTSEVAEEKFVAGKGSKPVGENFASKTTGWTLLPMP